MSFPSRNATVRVVVMEHPNDGIMRSEPLEIPFIVTDDQIAKTIGRVGRIQAILDEYIDASENH